MMVWNPGKFRNHKIENLRLMLNCMKLRQRICARLNIIHRGYYTFHLSYPYWTVTVHKLT
jgi:hypothetical protein